MGDGAAQQAVHGRGLVEPCQKLCDFAPDPLGWWGFIMDLGAFNRAGHHLHGASTIGAPVANGDLVQPGPPGREERGMPPEEALRSQGDCVIAQGIEHHLDDAVDFAIRGQHAAVRQP
ncbi:hypothetical protein [Magnetospirillum sp. SS-4]|uniref:hypothetical protein n=1 Tax=Magnetospirillum sp. SS-4 TaxID=2681465 RepID=UPI0020C2814C|nr:hypothetical protein [Magnetospirillum sp. SS-4]